MKNDVIKPMLYKENTYVNETSNDQVRFVSLDVDMTNRPQMYSLIISLSCNNRHRLRNNLKCRQTFY